MTSLLRSSDRPGRRGLATLLTCALACALSAATPDTAVVHDVVIYGDSSAAITAAIAAKREGRSVIVVNPTGFPGGMSSSGLGATDFLGKRGTFGGIASEFYDA
ncbi:MAG: FAD-dependent oxidoreductase, partial [Opitutaceae bacterium]